jgi:hypothetical protein
MIKEWLNEYHPKNNLEAEQALREIMQEIALFGLQQSGFFEVAAFYGGTALRIFHGLPRFSEDLDFSLLQPLPDFSLQPYLERMMDQLNALGVQVEVKEKIKTARTNVDSAFLKAGTEWKELIIKDVIPQEKLGMRPEIKIKLEVDTKPPQGFDTEQKLLLKPASFYVTLFTLPDLIAGKMHAVLFRKWKNRVKGRDWFDLEWYIRKGIPLHLEHLEMRARDSGDWRGEKMTEASLMQLLHEKIEQVSMDKVRHDVLPFIADARMLEIWSQKYFHDLVSKIRF